MPDTLLEPNRTSEVEGNTMWAYRGQLPSIQDKRNETIPALLWQQVKEAMLLNASDPNNSPSYTVVEMIALDYYDLQEAKLDYRD